MGGDVPRIDIFHADYGLDLHFGFIGEHEGHAFIINIQLSAVDVGRTHC